MAGIALLGVACGQPSESESVLGSQGEPACRVKHYEQLSLEPIELSEALGLIDSGRVLAVQLALSRETWGSRACRWYDYANSDGVSSRWKVVGTDVLLILADGNEQPILSDQEGFVGVNDATFEKVLDAVETYKSQSGHELLVLDDREEWAPPGPPNGR
jgi:hypothetical protein